jgi:hypothetical protein
MNPLLSVTILAAFEGSSREDRLVSRRSGRLAVVAALAAALVAAGCAIDPDDSVRLHRQADAALSRWANAVAAAGGASAIVVVGDLTSQIGDWEAAVGDNNKPALYAGMVELPTDVRVEAPSNGDVRWSDGTTTAVPLLTAQQAVAAIQATTSGPCPECRPLRIRRARLASGPVETSRGPASAPIWEFDLQDTAVKLTRVAIANAVSLQPPAWDPNEAPAGLTIDSATVSGGGRDLTVAFVGAPEPGSQPCGEDYTAEAVESELAVVIIVTRHPHMTIGACSAIGASRTADVRLAAPLGGRAVLDVVQGLPVPVALAP